uniref:Uncharacterized protein n=1 Tax=Aliivibrio wodanis TaxID=80852 RepID=A0A5Q4ZYY4_9GAMM|nr:hypothetical protein AW0309160_04559 [Aliivibrio wodanis]
MKKGLLCLLPLSTLLTVMKTSEPKLEVLIVRHSRK